MMKSETSLTFFPLTPNFGLEVQGFSAQNLGDPLLSGLLRSAFVASKGLLLFRELDGWRREDMVALSAVFGDVESSPSDGSFDSLLDGDSRVHVFSKVPSARLYDGTSTEDEDAVAVIADDEGAASVDLKDPDRYDPATGRPSWHTDQSFRSPPPRASAMFCVDTPPDGSGDTLFASTIEAYNTLPPALARRAEGVLAAHSYGALHKNFRKLTSGVSTDEALPTPPIPEPHPPSPHPPSAVPIPSECYPEEAILSVEREASLAPTLHPLVRVHRASGRKCLYLAPAAIGRLVLPELVAAPSPPQMPVGDRHLIDALAVHATSRPFRFRHRWQRNDFVVWDNTCTSAAPPLQPHCMALQPSHRQVQ